MDIKPKAFVRLLPFAFLLHNAEEVLAFAKGYTNIEPPFTIGQFAVATLLFTTLGFVVVFAKSVYNNPRYCYIIAGFAGMLFLNSFFPHLILTLVTRSYSPGVLTAMCLQMPLSFMVLYNLNRQEIMQGKTLVLSAIAGGLCGAVLVPVFLGAGWLFMLIF